MNPFEEAITWGYVFGALAFYGALSYSLQLHVRNTL